ncbi:phasin family protein [Tsuneonella sp. HG222]
MAESTDKAATSAEEAYAAAAAEAKPVAPAPKAEATLVKSDPAPAVSAKAEEPVAAAPDKTPAPKQAEPAVKAAARPAPAKKAAAKPTARKAKAPVRAKAKGRKPAIAAKSAPVSKKAPAKVAAARAPIKKARMAVAVVAKPAVAAVTKPIPSISQLKEKIMATAKTPDFSKPFSDAMGDMQSKAKAAYEKSTVYAGEMTDFAKGNVEAMVESGKILSAGMQGMGKSMVEEAKSAYETVTADVKEMASVKSPTELFQLQGKLARRNFDTFVSFSSKASDDMMKLYADAFAPISGRVSLAAEKLSKAA